jgi:hypothetical protein
MFMKRVLWVLLLGGTLLMGCASTFDFRREEIFEDTAKRYGRLIRWSDFESAKAYLAPAETGATTTLPKNVRVTEYEVKQLVYEEGKLKAVQIVLISYYQANDPRLRTLQDQQLWEFDSAKGAWLLKSGLPGF